MSGGESGFYGADDVVDCFGGCFMMERGLRLSDTAQSLSFPLIR